MIFSLTLYKAFTIGRGVELLYVIVRDGALSLVIYEAKGLIIHVRHHVFLVRAILVARRYKELQRFLQGTVLYEFMEYHDPSGALKSVSTKYSSY